MLLDSLPLLPPKNSPAVASSERPRILCVDDDPNVSAAISRRLRPYQIEVLRAYSGMQGYWHIVTTSPDAAVVDLAMPNGSGTEMIECVMRNRVTRHIPVIVLTGDSNPFTQRTLFRMGVSGFLRKPVTCERLLQELGQHIDVGEPAFWAAD